MQREQKNRMKRRKSGKNGQKPVKPTTQPSKPSENKNTNAGTIEKPASLIDKGGYIAGQVLPKEPKYVKNILIANKKYPLPKDYAEGEVKKRVQPLKRWRQKQNYHSTI